MPEDQIPKSLGKRNKNAGHSWELEIVKRLKAIGFTGIATSRAVSRTRDAQKVDLCSTDELLLGRLPYNIQAKNYSKALAYQKVLAEMPVGKEINVIFHKQTERKGERFLTRGTYAILNLDDFILMMEKLLVLEAELGVKTDSVTLKNAS